MRTYFFNGRPWEVKEPESERIFYYNSTVPYNFRPPALMGVFFPATNEKVCEYCGHELNTKGDIEHHRYMGCGAEQ